MSNVYDLYPKVLSALDLISQGQTRTVACDEAGVSIPTFEKYVEDDPFLKDMLVEAERRGHDALADALINIDNHKYHGHSDPKMAKVVSDNIKWLLERRSRDKYGQKIEVKHEVNLGKAILAALENAKSRTASIEAGSKLIDVTPSPSEDERIAQEILR